MLSEKWFGKKWNLFFLILLFLFKRNLGSEIEIKMVQQPQEQQETGIFTKSRSKMTTIFRRVWGSQDLSQLEDEENQETDTSTLPVDVNVMPLAPNNILQEVDYETEFNLEMPFEMEVHYTRIQFEEYENYLNANLDQEERKVFNRIASYTLGLTRLGKDDLTFKDIEKMVDTAKVYSRNFINFIKTNKWKIQENKIVKPEDMNELDHILDNLENIETDEENEKKYLNYKHRILIHLLRFYGKRSQEGHVVNACIQISYIPNSYNMMKGGYTNILKYFGRIFAALVNPESVCNAIVYPCKHLKYFKKKAGEALQPIFLSFFTIAIQIIAPIYMMRRVYLKKTTGAGGESSSFDYCPHNFSDLSSSTENWVFDDIKATKVVATLLFSYLYMQLIGNLKDEWKTFKLNWESKLFPTFGLQWSCAQNAISTVLVMFTTCALFVESPTINSIVLNIFALTFLVSVDEDLAGKFKVTKGLPRPNGDGLNVLMKYISEGPRDSKHLEFFSKNFLMKQLQFLFGLIATVQMMYLFYCI